MFAFSSFLTEQKNLHMEHLEDEVLNGGVEGTRAAINFLQGLRDMLAGNSDASELPANISLNPRRKFIAPLVPSTPPFNTSSSRCSM